MTTGRTYARHARWDAMPRCSTHSYRDVAHSGRCRRVFRPGFLTSGQRREALRARWVVAMCGLPPGRGRPAALAGTRAWASVEIAALHDCIVLIPIFARVNEQAKGDCDMHAGRFLPSRVIRKDSA